MSKFRQLVEMVFEHEGGLVDDPNDPGGRTIYGIAAKYHPEAWADGTPTKDDAAKIYEEQYWNPIRGNDLHPAVACIALDMAVNQGVKRTIKHMQAAGGSTVDGLIGPKTIAAANRNPARTIERMSVSRIEHWASRSHWKHFSTGWLKRAHRVYLHAASYL